jgi:hypothetical protein
MLLPRASYFNVWEISYWSRTVLIPLLIVMDRRPVHPVPRDRGVDELWAIIPPTTWRTRATPSCRGRTSHRLDGFEDLGGVRALPGGQAIRAAHDWLVLRCPPWAAWAASTRHGEWNPAMRILIPTITA